MGERQRQRVPRETTQKVRHPMGGSEQVPEPESLQPQVVSSSHSATPELHRRLSWSMILASYLASGSWIPAES
jgi:hypothetical protein